MWRAAIAIAAIVAATCLVAGHASAQLIQTVVNNLNDPYGVAVDGRGNVYVADTFNDRVLVLDTQTIAITVANVTIQPGQTAVVAGNGNPGYSGDNVPATSSELYNPTGVAVDGSGNIYIADLYNFRIRKVSPSGIITTVVGDGTQAFGGDDGPAADATLYPYAIALDSSGNLYIADTYNLRMRVVNTQTNPITVAGVTIPAGYIATVAGNGISGTSANVPALNAEFNDPYGIAIDSQGNIYVCDSYNRQIRVVDTGTAPIAVAGVTIQPGYITTVAGNGNYGYRGDGNQALTAEFADPDAVQVDAAGNIYVSDTENERVREISNATGLISTIVGTGVFGYNGDGILATTATIGYPRAIAIDSNNNVYFADEPDLRIREIVVNPGLPAITSRASTAFTVGVPGTFTVTTANLPTPALSESGGLPSWLTFVDNHNGTATLSGTPLSTSGSPFAITFTAKNSVGSTVQNFTLVIYAAGGAPAATFVGQDTTTEGNWQGRYGSDGYSLANITPQVIPSYATFAVANQINYTWDADPSDPRALEIPGSSNRYAATWYSNASFTLNVNLTDSNTHLFALYAVDWDYEGRSETVTIQDANTGAILDSETISNFSSGVYLVWNLTGNVQITVVPTGEPNGVISGAFFGGAGNSSAPTLVVTKTHTGNFTQGQQSATYTVNVSNAAYGTPTSGTVTVTDALPSGLSLVSMSGTNWSCTANACSRSNSLNPGASYPPITVTVNVAANAASPQVNQVTASGGGSPSASASDSTLVVGNGVASFVGVDTTTQGNWLQMYGSDGYSLANAGQSLPSYDSTFNAQNLANWTWAASTSDPRALETNSSGSRIAAAWYSTTTLSFNLSLTDSQPHQIAIYAMDWDSKGRTETIQIADGSSGAILDTRTLPGSNTSTTSTNFVNGIYLVWVVSGNVTITVTTNAGPNAVVSGIFWGGGPVSIAAKSGTPQSASTNSAFASLVATVMSGSNPVSGANVTFTAPTSGASGTFAGGSNTAVVPTNPEGVATSPTFTANSTVGGPYLVTAAVSGVAAPASFSLTNTSGVGPPASILATAGTPQSAATGASFTTQLQATVYDALNNPVPNASVTFTAPSTGASGTFAGASNAATVTTNGQGVAMAPIFTANNTAGGPYSVTATVSGVASSATFMLTNTQSVGCSGTCASFLSRDTTTEGNWKAKYGADGYSLANSAQSIPGYATFAVLSEANYTWNSSTSDPRALQIPGSSTGIAATWYSTGSFTFDLNVGAGAHQVALYAVDWDSQSRAETIVVSSAASGATLDTENISSFTTGIYLVWTIAGNVKITVTCNNGPNAVVSAVFFGAAPPTAVATFVSKDNTTEGAWQGKYGLDGYSLANVTPPSIPAYASFAPQNQSNYTWVASTNDPRALQIPGGTSGIAAAWYDTPTPSFGLDVNVGASSHRLSVYAVDWDSQGRTETIQVQDAVTGLLLDSETISSFSSGVYVIWNVTGHVTISITVTTGPNAVVSGAFFN
jgi:hypothetical protein